MEGLSLELEIMEAEEFIETLKEEDICMFLGAALSSLGSLKKKETKEAVMAVIYRAFVFAEISLTDLLTLIKMATIEKDAYLEGKRETLLH
jgi:hypothetical protein